MGTACGIVLSNARKRYGNSKEGKSKAMRAYQNCRKNQPKSRARRVKKVRVRRRRRSKFLGIF